MDDPNGIAVIGMSCRFPGANNIEEFWNNLKNGVESVTFFSDPELADAGVDLTQIKDGNYVRGSCIIDDIDLFDNRFFGYSPKEAETIDPQQRLFLMCAWECFEDAGYVPRDYDGFIGVFGGMRMSSYVNYLNFSYAQVGTLTGFQALIGNDKDYLTTRVSYKLNLKGPSVSIQTACSTSLVAVHMACESLRSGECDMALAGGAAITVPQRQGYFYQEDMIFSADGHCRAFDANANGIVGGNGLGVVLLKPLKEALDDKDYIYAVIKSSAVNNDGTAKAGYTAPSIEGQTAVISEALTMAEVKAEDITFIETHGTGTALGDPIEVEALDRVFREETGKKNYCGIGSVKTNVGHLDTAAGICSFIKTVLALKHKQIPPNLNFIEPNPRIDFKNTPFFVNTKLTDWQGNGVLRTAGVSSFGIGGTNAHVILQENPDPLPIEDKKEPPYHVLTISAQSEKTLKKYAEKYREFFSKYPGIDAADVCFTANTGRVHFSHRLAMTIDSAAQALKMLDAFLAGKKIVGLARGLVSSKSEAKKIAFLFTGQGSQYFNMGAELYNTQPVFKQEIDKCSDILSKYMDQPLLALLYNMTDHHAIDETQYAQPALFALEYALVKMLESWGIRPSAVMGHSVGEYAAACIAGVFSLEDGLKLMAARAKLMQNLPENGMMAAVLAEPQVVQKIIENNKGQVSTAAINGPRLTVISGLKNPVKKITRELKDQGIECRVLNVSHAFHSPLMNPILPEL